MNMKELIEIQTRLKVPKNNEAKGQNGRVIYKYRSCEDILEASKELLKELKCIITISDEIVVVGNRFYVKATVTLTNEKNESASATAFAREPEQLATMNQSQVTGTASSYARKYALNGLFAIDDTKDADTLQNGQPQDQAAPQQNGDGFDPTELFNVYAKPAIEQAQTKEELTRLWTDYKVLQTYPDFVSTLTARRKALGIKNSNEK